MSPWIQPYKNKSRNDTGVAHHLSHVMRIKHLLMLKGAMWYLRNLLVSRPCKDLPCCWHSKGKPTFVRHSDLRFLTNGNLFDLLCLGGHWFPLVIHVWLESLNCDYTVVLNGEVINGFATNPSWVEPLKPHQGRHATDFPQEVVNSMGNPWKSFKYFREIDWLVNYDQIYPPILYHSWIQRCFRFTILPSLRTETKPASKPGQLDDPHESVYVLEIYVSEECVKMMRSTKYM